MAERTPRCRRFHPAGSPCSRGTPPGRRRTVARRTSILRDATLFAVVCQLETAATEDALGLLDQLLETVLVGAWRAGRSGASPVFVRGAAITDGAAVRWGWLRGPGVRTARLRGSRLAG